MSELSTNIEEEQSLETTSIILFFITLPHLIYCFIQYISILCGPSYWSHVDSTSFPTGCTEKSSQLFLVYSSSATNIMIPFRLLDNPDSPLSAFLRIISLSLQGISFTIRAFPFAFFQIYRCSITLPFV